MKSIPAEGKKMEIKYISMRKESLSGVGDENTSDITSLLC